MDVAFKKLNITFPDENKSITAVEPLLFNPTILQAIDCIHKKGSIQMKKQFRST